MKKLSTAVSHWNEIYMNLGLVIKLDTKVLTCRKEGWILNNEVFSEMHKVERFSIDDVCEANNNKISKKSYLQWGLNLGPLPLQSDAL